MGRERLACRCEDISPHSCPSTFPVEVAVLEHLCACTKELWLARGRLQCALSRRAHWASCKQHASTLAGLQRGCLHAHMPPPHPQRQSRKPMFLDRDTPLTQGLPPPESEIAPHNSPSATTGCCVNWPSTSPCNPEVPSPSKGTPNIYMHTHTEREKEDMLRKQSLGWCILPPEKEKPKPHN